MMCTLSWLRTAGGYTIFMNRDEQRTRSPADPPAARRLGERLVVSPRDPDGGGSWISANDAGVTVALLNRRFQAHVPGMVSRGLAVTQLSPSASQAEALDLLTRLPLPALAPFALALFEPGQPAVLVEWDGQSIGEERREVDGLLLTSSSLDATAAAEARRGSLALLQRDGTLDASVLDALHRDHGRDRRLSACMHRDDAMTMSLSRIDVGPASVMLRYEAGSPCERHEPEVVSLPRRRPSHWQAAS